MEWHVFSWDDKTTWPPVGVEVLFRKVSRAYRGGNGWFGPQFIAGMSATFTAGQHICIHPSTGQDIWADDNAYPFTHWALITPPNKEDSDE